MRRKHLAAAGIGILLLGALAYLFWPRGGDADGKEVAGAPGGDAARVRRDHRGSHTDLRPGSVSGQVREPDGTPVPGATVSIAKRNLSRGERSAAGEAPEPIIAMSNADGYWQVTALAPGRYTVSAAARRHVPATVDPLLLAAAEDRSGVDLILKKGGASLSGTVADIGGGPIDGALVRATSISEGNVFHFFRAPFTAVTDGRGHYELGLADGAYMLEVFHGDYVGDQRWTEIRGERIEDFKLAPGAVIYGQVKYRADDQPVAGATVTWQSARGGGNGGFDLAGFGLSSTLSDPDGKFVLRGLRSGTVSLKAFGPGYASAQGTDVDLGIGEEATNVVIYVDRAWTISGYVVDKQDPQRGLDGVLVGAYNFNGDVHIARDSTAEDGWFEIHGVQNGSYFIGAAGEDRVVAAMGKNITVDNADVTDVIIELDAGATLTGRVEPPQSARVGLEIDPESVGFANIGASISAAVVNARSADDGTFTLRGVPQGKFTLSARADDGSEGKLPVEVTADQNGLVIHLEGRAKIAGVVVEASGQPVQGLRVEARPQKEDGGFSFGTGGPWSESRGVTAADGSFEVNGLSPGVHEVTVHDDKGPMSWARPEDPKDPRKPIEVTIEGTTPKTGMRLVVESRNGIIRGLVVGTDGAPLPDAWVTARRHEDDPLAQFRRGKNGKKAADAGDDGEGGEEGEGTESRTVTVSIGTGGSSVDTTSEKNDGVEDEKEANQRKRMRRYTPAESPVLTGADGRFEIRGLRDGTYDLEAEGLKGAARGEVENVHTGGDVTIRVATLAGITGKVTYLGKPVGSYTIQAEGPEERRTQVVSADGVFHINRLDPGSYTLSVIAPDGRAGGTVKVTANQTARKDLQLVAYGSVHGVLVDVVTGKPMDGVPVLGFSEQGSDMAGEAMNMMTGNGPKTDDQGRFRVGRLGAGKGTFLAIDGSVGGFEMIATREFELQPGQDLDLGQVKGQSVLSVPKDKRGELGMEVTVAPFAGRPRLPSDTDDALPAGLDKDKNYLWVESVDDRGAAAAAGMKVGDRIVAVQGADVELLSPQVAEASLGPRRIEAGKPIPFVIERDGRRNTINVTPRAAP